MQQQPRFEERQNGINANDIDGLTFDQLPAAVGLLSKKLDAIQELLSRSISQRVEREEKILDMKETCEFLSMDEKSLSEAVACGELPTVRFAGRMFFLQHDLTEFLQPY
jgi:hypothetical protein